MGQFEVISSTLIAVSHREIILGRQLACSTLANVFLDDYLLKREAYSQIATLVDLVDPSCRCCLQ